MSGNDSEDHNSACSAAPVAVLQGGTVGNAATRSDPEDQTEGHGDEHSACSDAMSPPLGVKLTGYRLFNMTTMFAFCITKGILTYEGQSAMPTTLDWISGGVLAVVLYWIGLYETRDSKKWEWFLQADLAPGIGYCTKRVVGEVMWLLIFFDGLLFISSLGNFLGNLAVLLFVRSRSHYPRGSPWGIYIGVFVSAHVLWYSADALVWVRFVRARGPGGQWAIVRFVNAYGPTLPGEKYGLRPFRMVLRIFCGVVALFGLSTMFYLYLVWVPLCLRPVGVVTICDDVCEGDCVTWCVDYDIMIRHPGCAAAVGQKTPILSLIQGGFVGNDSLMRYPEVSELVSVKW